MAMCGSGRAEGQLAVEAALDGPAEGGAAGSLQFDHKGYTADISRGGAEPAGQ